MLPLSLDVGIGASVSLPALVFMGLLVGYVAGLFGVGGGFLLTPLLMNVFGVPAPVAVGSTLCQNCGTSIASYLKYRHLKRGEPRIDLVMIGGSLMGVDAGTRALHALNHLPPWTLASGRAVAPAHFVLDVLFIVLLSFTSVFIFREVMLSRNRPPRGDATRPGPLATRIRIPPYVDLPNVGLYRVSVPLLAYLGFLLGVASGVMGVGGGVLFTPILLYGFGLSARNAAGTGILLLFVTVALGTVQQAFHGYVSLPLAMGILVGSSVGSQLGVLTTHHLPNRHLRMLFALLTAGTVLLTAWDLAGLMGWR
ncbi:MAG: sulfite exporter TauE/SafE family protein [Armatimonadetes bacterium]|nr:sulfite exporter TauE/SafE family protein [Armatimonadota bacterium]